MNVRVVVMLFMGLLLQLSQMQAWPTTAPVKSCCSGAGAMSCCASKQVCPCVDQSDSEQKPSPFVPASAELKLVFIHLSTSGDHAAPVAAPAAVVFSPTARAGSQAGFPGVPLSVAFCTFVI